MTSIPPSPSRPLSITVPARGIPKVEGCDDSRADTDIRPRLRVAAYEGQDPLEYAEAAARADREGITASQDPSQWLDPSYQTLVGTQGVRDISKPKPFIFGVLLPPSFEEARHYAEYSNYQHDCQHSAPITPPSADVTPDRPLHELAKWLRPLLPERVVGGLEVDPGGFADQLGVKGLSVYSAFIDMEDLRCRICSQGSDTIDLAILHQRHQRHYQV